MYRPLGPRLKIKRAKEHIDDLIRAVDEFFAEPPPPYTFRVEDEYDTGDLVYRAVVNPYSDKWLSDVALIAGDAIHNLRSALDFVAWQLVEVNGTRPSRRTSFPVADSWKEFENAGPGYIKGASEQAVELLRKVRPYKGGNNALWRLHRLDVADKHRLLLAVQGSYKDVTGTWRAGDGKEFRVRLAPPARTSTFPVVDEAELYRVPAQYRDSAKKHPEPEFTFEVAISDGDVITGQPLIPTLHESVGAVQNVLNIFLPILDPPTRRP
jgi:hypothetical protein